MRKKRTRPPMTVFIDRDGVLNRDPQKKYYVRRPADFRWVTGVFAPLKRLADAGARLVVVSNQAGVGKGLVTPENLEAITRKMFEDLSGRGIGVSAVLYCTHRPEDGCGCRKPATGLFRAADRILGTESVRRSALAAAGRYMIGDTERDMAAGRGAGCRTVLVLSGKTRSVRQVKKFKTRPDHTAEDLTKAVRWILAQKRS